MAAIENAPQARKKKPLNSFSMPVSRPCPSMCFLEQNCQRPRRVSANSRRRRVAPKKFTDLFLERALRTDILSRGVVLRSCSDGMITITQLSKGLSVNALRAYGGMCGYPERS